MCHPVRKAEVQAVHLEGGQRPSECLEEGWDLVGPEGPRQEECLQVRPFGCQPLHLCTGRMDGAEALAERQAAKTVGETLPLQENGCRGASLLVRDVLTLASTGSGVDFQNACF